MARVMFRCPITGVAVVTGASEPEYLALPDTTQLLRGFLCEACGLHHNWYKAEGWIERGDPS